VIVGSVLAFAGILLNQYWPNVLTSYGPKSGHAWALPAKFWLNGAQVAFAVAAVSAAIYVLVSLLSGKHRRANLDQLLHRGTYADVTPEQVAVAKASPALVRNLAARLLGYNEHFTKRDKFVAAGLVGWTLALSMSTVIAFAANKFFATWSAQGWANYWLVVGVIVPIVAGSVTFVWFGIGGMTDLRDFFVALKTLKRDAKDDGRGGGGMMH
jgi:SSS family solute:Na+ symporter